MAYPGLQRITMSEEDFENLDSANETTEEVENTEEVEGTTSEVETEDTTADVEELEEKNKKLFERAKKAEAEAREWKAKAQAKAEPKEAPEPSPEKQGEITPMDAILLSKSSITEVEDIEEVVNYAKFRGIAIKDALADKTMQTILREKAEQRQTAEATNTGRSRRGTAKQSPEQIVENAMQGKLPDDPEELAEARHRAKFKK